MYKKNYKRTRKHYKRSGRAQAKRWGASAGSAAYSALKMVRRLKDMVNTEYKINDVSNSAFSYDYNGTLVTLNAPTQGLADTQRIGDSIKCQNLVIRGSCVNSGSASSLTFHRIIILWDPQNKVSTAADVLAQTGSSIAPFSPKDQDKRFQTRILSDKMYQTSTLSSGNKFSQEFEYIIPINQHTQFSAGSTTINTGALKMLAICNLVSTGLPNMYYFARLSYTDN